MAAKRTIVLKGEPHINEEGVAAAVLTPGYLVDGVTSIDVHSTAGGACPRALVLERDELGAGIDTTYGSQTPTYAIGDTVKVGVFKPGERALVYIASGQNISANARLESAGDGTLRVYNSGVILARALEAVDARAVTRALLRVEWM